MKRRYVLAPQAARYLVQIRRYIKKEGGQETADRVETYHPRQVRLIGGLPKWRPLAARLYLC